ncbi:hypothetical protein ACI65C_001404 [Semiaphis heraclei]
MKYRVATTAHRLSNKKFEISIDEDRETSAFDEHNRNVVEGVQINSVHPNESVSISTRFTALLNAAVGVANTATDEAKLKGIKKLEDLVQILQQGQTNPINSGSFFPKVSNLPSHKNIATQRFHSTKKKHKASTNKLTKPTEVQKSSILETINSEERSSQTIHTDFDHVYYDASSKPQ